MNEYREYKVGDQVKYDDGETVYYGTITRVYSDRVWALWDSTQGEEWVSYNDPALSKLQQEPKQPKANKRFEYQYITFQVTEKSEIIEELNKLGEEGWQMVSEFKIKVGTKYQYISAYFMREKVDE